MPVLPYKGHHPEIAEGVFIAPNAYVVGRVRIAARSSIWFASTLRGDSATVEIGQEVNIQEACTLHTQAGIATRLGDRVSLGHHALVHAATVDDGSMIAIGASVLSGARVGAGSVVAAHALVPEGAVIPPGSLVMGVPGRVVRAVDYNERERLRETVQTYLRLAGEYEAAWAQADSPAS